LVGRAREILRMVPMKGLELEPFCGREAKRKRSREPAGEILSLSEGPPIGNDAEQGISSPSGR